MPKICSLHFIFSLFQQPHAMRNYSRLIKSSLVLSLILILIVFYRYAKNPNLHNNPSKNNPESASSTANLPIIAYQATIFDFGTLIAGESVVHEFPFTNIGTCALIIYEVSPSCNLCTKVSWPLVPIQPGESSTIQVTFNSTGRSGKQGKYVIVRANTDPNDTRLLIRGEVTAKSQ
jgi:hypothetical protein